MLTKIKSLLLLLAASSLTSGHPLAAQSVQTNAVPLAEASKPSSDALVARGKGVAIRRSQLDKEVDSAKLQLSAKGRALRTDEVDAAARQVLEQLINVQLVEAKATAADRAAGKEAAQKRLAATIAKLGSEDAFDTQLKLMATTRDEVMAKWIQALTGESLLKRQFNVNITDEQVRKYYDENPSQFQVQDSVRASHILFSILDLKTSSPLPDDQNAAKRKQAEDVLKRARGGEDFAKLAREFSDDPISKSRGGEYTFAHGQMVPEVEAAAFAMNTNQIGDIVTSIYGYHIIKVSEKIPAHKIDFAAAAPDIRSVLNQQAIEQQFPEYIAKLRQEAAMEILDEKLKPKEPGVQPIVVPPDATKRPG